MRINFFLIIFCVFCFSVSANYYSQFGQDRYVNDHFFNNKRNGVFVDIGANDGVLGSNSYFFEKELGWKGLCIEPLPNTFKLLQNNRNCICLNACIAPAYEENVPFLCIDGVIEGLSGIIGKYDPRHVERINYELKKYGCSSHEILVTCLPLNEVLQENGIYHIDFLSIDTEGGEFEILKSIDFDKYEIDVITVENNYQTKDIELFLKSKNYLKVTSLACDEIYVSRRAL